MIVTISFQSVYADHQSNEDTHDIGSSIKVKSPEDLSPDSPYNIDNLGRGEEIKHDLKYDGYNGYIQTYQKTVSNLQAYGIGGELGCEISWGRSLNFTPAHCQQ